MIPGYYGRLVYLCFASFFLVHALAGGAVILLAPAASRRARRMRAQSAARFLFCLRIIPFTVASIVVAGLCVPSYLWLEPRGQAEPVGTVCAAAAALGLLLWLLAGIRGLAAMARTFVFARRCRQSGRELHVSGEAAPVLIVDAPYPLLALSGVVRPRLFLSRAVYESLGPEELEAAFRHERAHRESRDNLKRLVFLLFPEVVPFARSFAALERHWAMVSEWAADDAAAAGDDRRALCLASALVRVARMGASTQPALAASLTACGCGLEARVNRLLRTAPLQQDSGGARVAPLPSVLLAGAFAAALLLLPGALSCVHGLLEILLR
jgi:Zn-dependent protease with chaperone function